MTAVEGWPRVGRRSDAALVETYTLATLPDPASLPVDTIVFVSDVDPADQWSITDGVIWRHLVSGNQNWFGDPPPTYDDIVLGHAALLAYWRLQEADSAVAAEDAGPGNLDLTRTGGTFGAIGHDGVSTAWSHTAAGEVLSRAGIAQFPNLTPFTAELIVKPTSGSGFREVMGRYGSSDVGWMLARNGGNIVFWRYPAATQVGGGAFADNTWYHIAATYDGENMRLYKNGALVGGPTASGSIGAASSEAFTVGAIPSYGQSDIAGVFERVALYTAALSDAEILEHAQMAGLA